MPLATEAREALIAPSSGLWSSANEMALYLLTALGRGVGPDGNRVVSAENLEATWQPQVDVSADTSPTALAGTLSSGKDSGSSATAATPAGSPARSPSFPTLTSASSY